MYKSVIRKDVDLRCRRSSKPRVYRHTTRTSTKTNNRATEVIPATVEDRASRASDATKRGEGDKGVAANHDQSSVSAFLTVCTSQRSEIGETANIRNSPSTEMLADSYQIIYTQERKGLGATNRGARPMP